MFTQEISLEINTDFDKKILVDEFLYLLSCYRKSGQIQSDNEPFYISKNIIRCNVSTLEKQSLTKKYNTAWVVNQRLKTENLFSSKLEIKVLGDKDTNYVGTCNCNKHDFLILFTHLLNTAGPLDCGNCFKPITLYRIAEFAQEFKQDILSWEQNYQSCDNLQLSCTVGEKWATNQMTEHNSQLAKEGIGICKQIKNLTGIPTFYYLHNYRKIKLEKDTKRLCPSCEGKWILKKALNKFYNFKCDKCELISSFTSNRY